MNTERCVDLDTVYTNNYIGVPMTPGHWVSKSVEYTPITRLRMSCGGGIGGAQWFEYVNRVPLDELAEMKSAIVTTWNGKRKLINMNYVVEAEKFTIAIAVYDSMNPNFQKGEYLVARLLEDGSVVSLSDKYLPNL